VFNVHKINYMAE